jgi:hypothetical protein
MARLASMVAVEAHSSLAAVSPVGLPGRRLALTPAALVQGNGQDLLDFLGEDLQERAHQLVQVLKRCTETELAQLMETMNEALKLRAQAEQAPAGPRRR